MLGIELVICLVGFKYQDKILYFIFKKNRKAIYNYNPIFQRHMENIFLKLDKKELRQPIEEKETLIDLLLKIDLNEQVNIEACSIIKRAEDLLKKIKKTDSENIVLVKRIAESYVPKIIEHYYNLSPEGKLKEKKNILKILEKIEIKLNDFIKKEDVSETFKLNQHINMTNMILLNH
jgi:hypothetical protein